MSELILHHYDVSPYAEKIRLAMGLKGLPSFPITLTAPWFGPAGMAFALPVKYHIHFGEPLHLEGDPDAEDAVIEDKVEVVKRAVADLLAHGRATRRGIFT